MQIKSLDVSYCPIHNDGLEELLRWPRLSGVRRLYLSHTKITTAGAEILAGCEALAELRELVCGNLIGVDGYLALARSPHLNRLTRLSLYDAPGTKNPTVQQALRKRFRKAVSW